MLLSKQYIDAKQKSNRTFKIIKNGNEKLKKLNIKIMRNRNQQLQQESDNLIGAAKFYVEIETHKLMTKQ